MPKSIPAGLTQDHVLRALAELDAGAAHPFGPPTGYELVHGGKRYAPKAVVGLAFRHAAGRALPPDEFSGGEAPGQANFVLRRLGFAVVRKGEPVEAEEPKTSQPDWSADEVRLVVADYFAMLEKELLGRSLNKTEHRRALVPQLAGRSGPAVESAHANISAILAGQGLPYIDGYEPRGNDQAQIAHEVESFLDGRPGFLDQLASAAVLNPGTAPDVTPDAASVIEDPPETMTSPAPTGKPWLSRRGRRIDFVERDARSRALGRLGEGFVVALERERLRAAGRDDLAGRVEHVAETLGDGLGFDVLSFDDADNGERLIEVKTTALGKYHPFLVTATEVRCSEDVSDRFQLFRVFDFGRRPRAYVLAGSLRANCRLDPTLFRAAIGA